MTRTIIEKQNCFYIQFDFNRKINLAVQSLPDAQLNTKYKRWEVDICHRDLVFNFGERYGFQLPDGKSKRKVFDEPIGEMPKLKVELDLLMKPYEHQKEGVAYFIEHGSSIDGDAPGAGKTLTAIATVCYLNLFPCLVVSPASLKYNWLAEFELATDKHKALILTDSVKHTWPIFNQMGMYDVFLTNYESLKKYFVVNINVPPGKDMKLEYINFHPNIKIFKSIIFDEAHRCRNTSSLQSKLSYGISTETFNIPLTGTPIVNKPIDLLPLLMITRKIHFFGGVKNFREMCVDNSRWSEINYLLRTHCYFRREKKDVIKNLPDLTRQKIYCEIDNPKEYDAAVDDLANYLREWKQATDQQVARSMRGKVMVQLGVLKNISARGKMKDVISYIDDIVESGEKIVVFLYLHEIADILREKYPKALFYTGRENEVQKDAAIHNFQKCNICNKKYERHKDESHEFEPSEYKIIFVNYRSGGEGITLTAASIAAHIEQGWTPKDREQPESRLHRNSQKQAVFSGFFIGRGTIDDYIYNVVSEKEEMSNACTGADSGVEESVMENVLELLMKGK